MDTSEEQSEDMSNQTALKRERDETFETLAKKLTKNFQEYNNTPKGKRQVIIDLVKSDIKGLQECIKINDNDPEHSHMTKEVKQEMLNNTVKHKSERVLYTINETTPPGFLTQESMTQEGGVTEQNPTPPKK